jgi:protein O-mannosyl-transferase
MPIKAHSVIISPGVLALGMAAICLLVFAGVLYADFVMWDDDLSVYQNPHLGPLSSATLHWALTDVDATMRYIPLSLLSWVLTYQFFGLDPFGYHLGNWLLHGASTALLFLVVEKLLGIAATVMTTARRYWIASLAALFWAVHPLRVEPVAWVTDRTYCLAMFFCLLATLLYIQAKRPVCRRSRIYLVSAWLAYTAALLSHPVSITYWLMFVVLDSSVLRQTTLSGWLHTAQRQLLLEKLAFAVPAVSIALISVLVRIQSAGAWSPPVGLAEFSLAQRLMQAFYMLAYYPYKTLLPLDLSPVYTSLLTVKPLAWQFVLSMLGVLVAFSVAWVYRRRCPLCLMLVGAYLLLMLPVLGLLEHPHYHNDRYGMLPALCFSLLLALVLSGRYGRKFLVNSGIAAMILLFASLSVQQTQVWRNSESLFVHMIGVLRDDPYRQDIYWRLGKHLFEQRRFEEAEAMFAYTLQLNPFHPKAHKYLGHIAYLFGHPHNAAKHLQQLLYILPADHSDTRWAHDYLAHIQAEIGDLSVIDSP